MLLFVGLSLLIGIGGLVYYDLHYPDLDETRLAHQNEGLKLEWEALLGKIHHASDKLAFIEQEDDGNYRVVLDMVPLDKNIRQGGAGGHEAYQLEPDEQVQEIKESYDLLTRLNNRTEVQAQSLSEIEKDLTIKEEMMVTRPAMMPIDNRQLIRFNSIYGPRLHPIFGVWKNHNGLDLTADYGTPVYAVGNGIVSLAHYNGGYGNVIFLNHGFGYETRYAHLSRYNVVEGQRVKRGDIIGFVGSTGFSTNPHLHFEVLYRDQWRNPTDFMYRDLKQEEYNKLIQKRDQDNPKMDLR
ncbi:MAG: M23 family metallopeptidase [Cyclobacteriaceae bacterium]|nr:M23 family metallopeptidase [Cyclobacteriaceae bacterium]